MTSLLMLTFTCSIFLNLTAFNLLNFEILADFELTIHVFLLIFVLAERDSQNTMIEVINVHIFGSKFFIFEHAMSKPGILSMSNCDFVIIFFLILFLACVFSFVWSILIY